MAARLVDQIRTANPAGRFLKVAPNNSGMFIEIGDHKAWKKAGQALREDGPDVRREIDEVFVGDERYNGQPMSNMAGVHPGVPSSVSCSPTAQAAAPISKASGNRPDPPSSVGVTGYRQPPLRYLPGGGGAGGVRKDQGPLPPQPPNHLRHPQYAPSHVQYAGMPGAWHPSASGAAPPHPGHVPYQQAEPQYQGYVPQPGHNGHPPPQQHPYPHPHPGPQFHQQPGYSNNGHQSGMVGPPYKNMNPPPQAAISPTKDMRDRPQQFGHAPSPLPRMFHDPVHAISSGVHKTIDKISDVTDNIKRRTIPTIPKRGQNDKTAVTVELERDSEGRQVAFNKAFIPTESNVTDLTISSVSTIVGMDLGASGKSSTLVSPGEKRMDTPLTAPSKEVHDEKEEATSDENNRTNTMSDLSMAGLNFSGNSLGFSFGLSGRTRSFPDLMLSTGPPRTSVKNGDTETFGERGTAYDGQLLRPPPQKCRTSSSESSEGFSMGSIKLERSVFPLPMIESRRTSEAMSTSSIDSRRSIRSDSSSWLDTYKGMLSVESDQNPWSENGSMRSLLTDISSELMALDLAEPLLPPYQVDRGLEESNIRRPDP